MPAGKTHNFINTLSFIGIVGLGTSAHARNLIELQLPETLAFTIAFFAGTFMLSPDLDLAERHVLSKRAWGIFGFLWVPYGLVMRHRGLSHSWIIGPLTRLVYLALFFIPLAYLVGLSFKAFSLSVAVVIALALGFYLSQWMHLIADGIAPDLGVGRRKRKKSFKRW